MLSLPLQAPTANLLTTLRWRCRGKPLGGSFIALGMLVLLLGAYRFFSVQSYLTRGKFRPGRIEGQ